MLKVTRKRGRYWYAGGTVKAGQERRVVEEHSTGAAEREIAEEYVAQLHSEIRHELIYGVPRRPSLTSFADAGNLYVSRPEGVAPGDLLIVEALNEVMGDAVIPKTPETELPEGTPDIIEGWTRYRLERCVHLAPATVDRHRAILQAVLNYAAFDLRYSPPRLPHIRFSNQCVRWLTLADADRLINAYAPHTRPVFRALRYQGLRTQEALQLDFRNINMKTMTAFIERTKSGAPRTVQLHPIVAADIGKIWRDRKKPAEGRVFLNRFKRAYADTRDYKFPGGNPLRAAHRTALARLAKEHPIRPNGGENFRPHDWRHHWASWMVMDGVDLITIRDLGGWKDLRMVERYAAVSPAHQAKAVARAR